MGVYPNRNQTIIGIFILALTVIAAVFWKQVLPPPSVPTTITPKTEETVLMEQKVWGEQLFVTYGCNACHHLPNYEISEIPIAPSLKKISAKIAEPGWLTTWLENPQHIQPSTHMPNYYPDNRHYLASGLDKNVEKEWKSPRQIRQEVLAMAAYLWNQSTHISLKNMEASQESTSIIKGQALFQQHCIGCHAIAKAGGNTAPALDNIGSKVTSKWLYDWIAQPSRYDPTALMPALELSDSDIQNLVNYLMTMNQQKFPSVDLLAVPISMQKKGKQLIENYNCQGCHPINGILTKISGPDLTELATKITTELNFGNTNIPRTLRDWTYNKIMRPRIFNDTEDLKMPQYHLTEDEGAALTTFLLQPPPTTEN